MSTTEGVSNSTSLDIRKQFIAKNKEFIVCEPSGRFLKDLEIDKIQKFKLIE